MHDKNSNKNKKKQNQEKQIEKIAKLTDALGKELRSKDSIAHWVDCIFEFAGVLPEFQERMKGYLTEVWTAAGKDISFAFGHLSSVVMIATSCCRNVRRPPSELGHKEEAQIILLDLTCVDEKYAKYVMAHETGHWLLNHWLLSNKQLFKETSYYQEIEATTLAEKWGFPPPMPPDAEKPEKKEKDKKPKER